MAGTTDYNRNSVVWQAGTVVYSVHHFDPIRSEDGNINVINERATMPIVARFYYCSV